MEVKSHKICSIIFGVITIAITVFLAYVGVTSYVSMQTDGWAAIGLVLVVAYSLIAVAVLLVPFVVMLIVVKYRRMRFFFYSYLSMLVVMLIGYLLTLL